MDVGRPSGSIGPLPRGANLPRGPGGESLPLRDRVLQNLTAQQEAYDLKPSNYKGPRSYLLPSIRVQQQVASRFIEMASIKAIRTKSGDIFAANFYGANTSFGYNVNTRQNTITIQIFNSLFPSDTSQRESVTLSLDNPDFLGEHSHYVQSNIGRFLKPKSKAPPLRNNFISDDQSDVFTADDDGTLPLMEMLPQPSKDVAIDRYIQVIKSPLRTILKKDLKKLNQKRSRAVNKKKRELLGAKKNWGIRFLGKLPLVGPMILKSKFNDAAEEEFLVEDASKANGLVTQIEEKVGMLALIEEDSSLTFSQLKDVRDAVHTDLAPSKLQELKQTEVDVQIGAVAFAMKQMQDGEFDELITSVGDEEVQTPEERNRQLALQIAKNIAQGKVRSDQLFLPDGTSIHADLSKAVQIFGIRQNDPPQPPASPSPRAGPSASIGSLSSHASATLTYHESRDPAYPLSSENVESRRREGERRRFDYDAELPDYRGSREHGGRPFPSGRHRGASRHHESPAARSPRAASSSPPAATPPLAQGTPYEKMLITASANEVPGRLNEKKNIISFLIPVRYKGRSSEEWKPPLNVYLRGVYGETSVASSSVQKAINVLFECAKNVTHDDAGRVKYHFIQLVRSLKLKSGNVPVANFAQPPSTGTSRSRDSVDSRNSDPQQPDAGGVEYEVSYETPQHLSESKTADLADAPVILASPGNNTQQPISESRRLLMEAMKEEGFPVNAANYLIDRIEDVRGQYQAGSMTEEQGLQHFSVSIGSVIGGEEVEMTDERVRALAANINHGVFNQDGRVANTGREILALNGLLLAIFPPAKVAGQTAKKNDHDSRFPFSRESKVMMDEIEREYSDINTFRLENFAKRMQVLSSRPDALNIEHEVNIIMDDKANQLPESARDAVAQFVNVANDQKFGAQYEAGKYDKRMEVIIALARIGPTAHSRAQVNRSGSDAGPKDTKLGESAGGDVPSAKQIAYQERLRASKNSLANLGSAGSSVQGDLANLETKVKLAWDELTAIRNNLKSNSKNVDLNKQRVAAESKYSRLVEERRKMKAELEWL